MSGVALKSIVKSYGETTVVHGIDLEVKSQEFVVLVGPSGCGKSTTLRMVAGLEEISAGEVTIGDRLINNVAPKDRDVAMVFQNYALYPHLNVADNIAFGLRIRKTPEIETKRLVAEVAKILGLEEYLDRQPKDLSGGQRQRVAMGRAIVRHPKVFLFDEPLSNLDAKLRTQMRAEIKRLHKRLGVTSIYVTHDQVEAMTLADRIVIMRDGYIEQVGTPMEVFNHPINTFVASFMGSPAMNQVNATLVKTEHGYCAQIGDRLVSLPQSQQLEDRVGKEIVVGVRPEYVSIVPLEGTQGVPIEVDLLETLGSEALLHTHVGDAVFVIKAETIDGLEHLHALKEIYFNPSRMTVFDAETGIALNHPTMN
ncbi:sn-glycerol-3-phosphate ABC transporter ATP-binding protein UgpC [Alginatibacterium sediminis]|uniref:sn-glycerol-3-phosphate ABC transporter ATP-binding protein UgpC n=1 Tax=Alginatibacterium sediminis TaxID=2164068 RepID=A0A420EHG5_9ALTE|nr:sn-glycerol-3-phosphate ABC transporter ATP-binding protein UgpC [Alginatibacterium sediminis]RKF20006.1 sn-glycerol-3-phosphate ABC transporter ATP-binding protein UgpC [Alginatibacterium sediminis]